MQYRDFWEAGYRVFPLWPVKDGKCTCGRHDCEAAHKHPSASNWQHTPYWDEDQIDTMQEYGIFGTGYGVLCKGLLVVDVDARNGGVASYQRLIEAIPEVSGAGLVVNTGSGGGSKHLYFSAPEGVSLLQNHPMYPGLDFKTSGFVVGPGSSHASGKRYEIAVGSPDDIEAAPRALLEMLHRPERHRAEYDGRPVDVSHSDIADMLRHIDPDCDYDTWIRCGMAVHHATGGTGFDVWDTWSQGGAKYPDGKKGLDSHWHSFGRSANPVTLGTLVHHAEAGGWEMPVTFIPQTGFDLPEDEGPRDGLPFDIGGVDLKKPPGFVGALASWIDSQSRRPRANIAVAGALTAMGNVAGLKYTDDRDGVATNLFTFCIAGSRTGKDAIDQAVQEIHRAVGLGGATHGIIKSEQEIIRNLIRHQASFYVNDETGIFLQKVKNAQDRGGAAYLEAAIGMMMSVYGRANGFLLLSGDLKEETRKDMQRELSQVNKKIDEGTDTSGWCARRAAAIERALANLDKGIERPFLSLMGSTTPVTFNHLVDFASATNGFIGRSLLFHERDTAPRSRKGFRKEPLPEEMVSALMRVSVGAEFDMNEAGGRIEHYGEKIKIPTDAKASAMLDAALDWLEDRAIDHKSSSGLESLYLGAYELVSKVSLILAISEGVRTSEHVRWAFALIKRDVDDKVLLTTSNDTEKSDPMRSMCTRIFSLLGDDGETEGVIVNRIRAKRREDVTAALQKLVTSGAVRAEAQASAKGRKPTTRYFRA